MSSSRARAPGTALPTQPEAISEQTWKYVEKSYHWYDAAARRTRITYWTLKVISLTSAAIVTVLAAGGASGVPVAVCAGLGLLAEGFQQTGQFHANYINYRLVAEGIYVQAWQASQDDFEGSPEQRTKTSRLAATVTALISSQNSAWADRMRHSIGETPPVKQKVDQQ